MPKKDVLKRMGQIYALGIQHGFTEEEIVTHLNNSFKVLYTEKRQREMEADIGNPNYQEKRYSK
jgi:hypothetical protein